MTDYEAYKGTEYVTYSRNKAVNRKCSWESADVECNKDVKEEIINMFKN